MVTKTVEINDKGFNQAIEALERLGRMSVKIGIQADSANDKYDNGASVLDVAIFNEFGTDKIPSRPFIRQCFALHSDMAAQMLGKVAKAVSRGGDPKMAMSQLGEWYQGKMKHTLLNYAWQPNSPATIKRKKSSKPLVDTGQLVNSIRYEVLNE